MTCPTGSLSVRFASSKVGVGVSHQIAFIPLGYHRPYVVVPRRYRRILFTAFRCDSFGHDWYLAHMHTLNIMSGLEAVRYNNEPIIPRYNFTSTSLPFSSLSRLPLVAIGVSISFDSLIPNLLSNSMQYLV